MANKRFTHPAETIEQLKKKNRRRLVAVSVLVVLAGILLIYNLNNRPDDGSEAGRISIQTASGMEEGGEVPAASENADSDTVSGVVLEPEPGRISQTDLANPFGQTASTADESGQAAPAEDRVADGAEADKAGSAAVSAAVSAPAARQTVDTPEPVVTISGAGRSAEQAAQDAREKAAAATRKLAEEKRRAAAEAAAAQAEKDKAAAQAQRAADAEKARLRQEAQAKREAEEQRSRQEAEAKKAAESEKRAQEKRAAELKKQQEAARAAEAKKREQAKAGADRRTEEKRAADRARAALNNQAAKNAKADPQAILNGKAGGGAVIQAGAFTALAQAEQVQQKLAGAGISAYIREADTSKGKVYRVRTGAYPSRAAAEAALAKVRAQGLDGMVIGR
ncbi:SPOR domain-containing protein [Neisseria leonii]|uniref:SPOR domain-containing protein n=1 Tax=Neisseria leonii TaxID=2995413 RepID=A0A9X4E1B7_9NEIS|nr:SPOR domain-containing protein [Neisseria sp. 51.81]MDD9327663.1 SPOR domain-containing protein [Neisseria sp. 51.81]